MSVTVVHGAASYAVKQPPNSTMKVVLEAACSSFQISPSEFELFYKNNAVDETLTLRFANFPHGTKLQLGPRKVKAAQPIRVALQLPDGIRLQDSFPSSMSFWHMLEQFEQKSNGQYNFTTKRGRPSEEEQTGPIKIHYTVDGDMRPVLSALNRTFNTIDALKNTTIASLVSSGSILFKLTFEYVPPPADPNAIERFQKMFAQATAAAEQVDSTAPAVSKQSSSSAQSSVSPALLDLVRNPAAGTPKSPPAAPALAPVQLPLDRHRRFLRAPPGSFDPRLFEVHQPDFYDIDDEDIAAYVRSVKTKDRKVEEWGSKTSAHFATVTIRFRLPDRYYLEARFLPHETIRHLHNFVQSCLVDPSQHFSLFVAPPRVVLSEQPSATLIDMRLVPSAIVTLSMDGFSLEALKEDVRSGLIELAPRTPVARPDATGESAASESAEPGKYQTDAQVMAARMAAVIEAANQK